MLRCDQLEGEIVMLKAKLARASEAGGKAATEASEYRNKVAELERKLLEEERDMRSSRQMMRRGMGYY